MTTLHICLTIFFYDKALEFEKPKVFDTICANFDFAEVVSKLCATNHG